MRMTNITDLSDPSTWGPELDAVKAAPKHHKVLFENDRVRVLEVTLEPNDEEPVHHHRWPSVFVLDQIKPPVVDISPAAKGCRPTATSSRRLRPGTATDVLWSTCLHSHPAMY
jgi:hypothetical protein